MEARLVCSLVWWGSVMSPLPSEGFLPAYSLSLRPSLLSLTLNPHVAHLCLTVSSPSILYHFLPFACSGTCVCYFGLVHPNSTLYCYENLNLILPECGPNKHLTPPGSSFLYFSVEVRGLGCFHQEHLNPNAPWTQTLASKCPNWPIKNCKKTLWTVCSWTTCAF